MTNHMAPLISERNTGNDHMLKPPAKIEGPPDDGRPSPADRRQECKLIVEAISFSAAGQPPLVACGQSREPE
jgi:hypothetical protein